MSNEFYRNVIHNINISNIYDVRIINPKNNISKINNVIYNPNVYTNENLMKKYQIHFKDINNITYKNTFNLIFPVETNIPLQELLIRYDSNCAIIRKILVTLFIHLCMKGNIFKLGFIERYSYTPESMIKQLRDVSAITYDILLCESVYISDVENINDFNKIYLSGPYTQELILNFFANILNFTMIDHDTPTIKPPLSYKNCTIFPPEKYSLTY